MQRSLIVLSLALIFGGCDSNTSVGGSTSSDEPPDPPSGTTFQVEVVPASEGYPNPNANSVVFEVDDVQGALLTLVRGETYVFQMNNTPGLHPFFISTSSTGGGGGADEWTDGVTGSFATGNDAVTFVVPNGAPDLLYYHALIINLWVGGSTSSPRDVIALPVAR